MVYLFPNYFKENNLMKLFKFVSLLVLALMLLTMLTACSGPEPLKMDNLPIYTGAKATDNADYLSITSGMTEAIKQSGEIKAEGLETRTYTASKDAKWEDVEKYYDAELAKADWKTDPQLTSNDPTVHGKGWIRGQQVFAVFFAANEALPDTILITFLGSVK
jgi:hypothetical protein